VIREQVVQFGASAKLTGIVTLPRRATPDRPVLILLNSGILHHVGSCRLHVRVARALAEAGFTALRFDFSGIGDSEPRRDTLVFEESAPLEVQEAMNYLSSSRGARSFILMGLCSGADMAHLTAVCDERVRGVVQIDPWAYRTPMYWVHHYASRVFRWSAWRHWATVRVNRVAGGPLREASLRDDAVEYDVPKYVRRFPERSAVERDLRALTVRGVRTLAIFTSGQSDIYNHEGQYRRAFAQVPFNGLLDERFLHHADHIITGLEDQRQVIDLTCRWALSHFASESSEVADHRVPLSG
jgi:pimeloyl-ACP methyl ester carboxylesterase